ncbi:MAG: hypothetical protein IPO81_09655 [Kouleothrix sp.]|nr:hypothetical protein [Kouleothrix sp.]
MARKNQNLYESETAASLGLTATSGPYAGNGSALQLDMAIIRGLVAPLRITNEVRAALVWLGEARAMCIDDVAHAGIDQIVGAIELAHARQAAREKEPAA